jgi:hypothetical protein
MERLTLLSSNIPTERVVTVRSSTSKCLAVFVVLGVIAIPFLAGYIADHTTFSQITVTSGVPDADTVEKVKHMAASVLRPEESIQWVGQPEVGREGSVKMWFFMPFAVLWTLFSTAWVSMAIYATRQAKHPVGWLMVLFGVPFVLVGLVMLTTPYFSRQQEFNTVYVLTNQGAVKVVSDRVHRMVEYKERDFGPVEVTHYGDGKRADVLFVKDSSEGHTRPYGGFYGVQDADTAAAILNGRR